MKLNKGDIEKTALSLILALAPGWFYFAQLLGPLSVRYVANLKSIGDLEAKIKDAKTQIAKTESIAAADHYAMAARESFSAMKSSIPDGPPVAWYQPRLAELFKEQGICEATYRWNSDAAEPELPGFKSCSWAIDFPRIEFASFVIALARLENQEGLSQVKTLKIEAAPETDPEFQHVRVNLSTIVKDVKQ